MGILEDWGISLDELGTILSDRPSVRGILIGFLAEYKLAPVFRDARIHAFRRYDDHDRNRPADFGFQYEGFPFSVEVKSLQTNSVKRTDDGWKGAAQVDASDKRPVTLPNGTTLATTCLLAGGFDILALNIFEFGHTWRFAYIKNSDLQRSTHKAYTAYQKQHLLATSVKVEWPLKPPFHDNPFTLLKEMAAEKRAAAAAAGTRRRRRP